MQEQLKTKLADLHQALSRLGDIDDETRALLSQLSEDIQHIQKGEPIADNLTERIEQQTVKFEGEHPQMSAILRDIIDVLGKMGI